MTGTAPSTIEHVDTLSRLRLKHNTKAVNVHNSKKATNCKKNNKTKNTSTPHHPNCQQPPHTAETK